MSRRRASFAILAIVVLAGCGSDTMVDGAGEAPPSKPEVLVYPLPFGLQQVEGTSALARPVVAELAPRDLPGPQAQVISLRAAYRVTGSPEAVMTLWSEQFAELGIGGIRVTTPSMRESDGPDPWLELSTSSLGSYWSHGSAELWSTEEEPLLLIEVDRQSDLAPQAVEVPDMPELPLGPAPIPVALVSEGDALFGPQGGEIHLPPGAQQVMPSVPSISGTDGEVVMLTTDDPIATVTAIAQGAYDRNEAQVDGEPGSLDGPHVVELDGSTAVSARFSSGIGGWGFEVLASQGPGDDPASVWVRTSAD